eukprot:28605-Pelagomonas_calceolata.AAC.4
MNTENICLLHSCPQQLQQACAFCGQHSVQLPLPLLRYITIVTVALLVAIFDPYNAAFVKTAGMAAAVADLGHTDICNAVQADIVLKFFLAYKDENNKCIIVDNRAVAWQYFT